MALLAHPPQARPLLLNHSGYSGAEDTLADTVHALPEGEFDKTAFIPAPGLYADRMHAAGCRVFQWTEDLSAPTARNVSAISDLLKTLKPDVIHLNAYAGMPILTAARTAGIPLIQHLRLPDLTRLEESIRESSIVLAVSDYVRRQAAGIPVPPRRIQVLYDGVNTTRFDPSHEDKSAARQSLGIDATRIVILLAARLERRKRADLFIAAIKTAAATNPNVLGLVVGDGSQDPDWTSVIDRAIEESGVDVVRRLPFQPDMRGVYPAADVVVSCSDREPLGCSILEAMAMELPTIVSDSGGTMELLQPDRTGLIFPAGEANELARAISKLTNDPQLRIRMGRRARRHVLSRFSIERCAAALASHLAALCKPQK